MGFTLEIINAPAEATHWNADFYSEEEGSFISSGAIALDETWDCAYNPYGATDLRIRVLDMVNAITLLDALNLGPIYDGKSYIYDCSTGVLTVAVSDWFMPLISIAVMIAMIAMIVPVMKKGF